MHRGVQAVISWIAENPTFAGVALRGQAEPHELARVEEHIGSPLPSDLRVLLSHYNGGELPTGTLLTSSGDAGDSVLGTLAALAKRLGRPVDDPELPLPFFQSGDGALLAFDRGAGPVADTWPIIDCPPEGDEIRLVHRTFDGWCRLCLSQWTAPDFAEGFSLARYLRDGKRHVAAEPDVAAAHATVAHALRRSGQPEQALASYLKAGRCVPSVAFCNWEALKLALLLRDVESALEAAARLCARAPKAAWRNRATQPLRVADALSLLVAEVEPPEPLLLLLDQLRAQADNEADAQAIAAIRHAIVSGDGVPTTHPVRSTAVPAQPDPEAWWSALEAGYQDGKVREEDLLLDPAYRPLRKLRPLSDVLRIPREF